jgi:hypothetical protein
MNIKKIIDDQRKTYVDNFIKHKDSSLGTFQNDRATQYLRFERIIKPFREILNDNVSLHDFGCGVCDLHQYLLNEGIGHDYSGTEVIQEMVDHAKGKYPGIKVYNRDVISNPVPDKYDIVVFSGGLYLPGSVPGDEWEKFVYKVLDTMWNMSNIGISFNLLTTYSDYRRPDLFYVDPKEMFDFCVTRMSRFVTLDHSYPLYEWTIAVFKPEFMKKRYTQPEFQKYLK